MRVFVALPLPHAAAATLAAGLEPLRSQTTGIRWVNASGFHVTLHFFGEADSTQVDELSRALAEPGLRGPAISARLGGLGQFPPQGSPRALWVSLASGGAEARGVWQAVEKTVAALGWQLHDGSLERRFSRQEIRPIFQCYLNMSRRRLL